MKNGKFLPLKQGIFMDYFCLYTETKIFVKIRTEQYV